jgi:hypothetical protein
VAPVVAVVWAAWVVPAVTGRWCSASVAPVARVALVVSALLHILLGVLEHQQEKMLQAQFITQAVVVVAKKPMAA